MKFRTNDSRTSTLLGKEREKRQWPKFYVVRVKYVRVEFFFSFSVRLRTV